jgi:hypothetical protein
MSKLTKFKKDKKNRGFFLRKEIKILSFKYGLLSSSSLNGKRYYLYKFMQRFHLN